MIAVNHLRAILQYDPATGNFVWKAHKRRPDLIGKRAGSPTSAGYWAIAINNKKQLAHRLAWLYMTGSLPTKHIDHIDGNKLNNKFDNLRDVTKFENLQNMKKAKSNSKSGFLGASPHQGKWRMQLMINGKLYRKSGFNTPEEAHAAYLIAKEKQHLLKS